MTVRIIHERELCIGCGACAAVCPKFWEMGDDGKSHVKGSTTKKGNEIGSAGVTFNEILELPDAGCCQEAADVCPVQCIHLKKK